MTVRVAVVGLGYVGLPLAQAALARGLDVTGFDASSTVVAGLNEGRSHIDDLEDEAVDAMLASGFRATTDEHVLAEADVITICVPTPLAHGGPDLGRVVAAGEAIARHLTAGTTVILESTSWPGTTEEVLAPVLEKSGLRPGEDFFLAFSPERIDPGNDTWDITNTPKIVGGVDGASTDAAARFYSHFVGSVVRAKGTREAETAKLLENTYRHINIALVNEMARFCHELDIDLWDVIACAASKPFGFQPFFPGPGVGGHCIPIDPNYLSYRVKARLGYPFRFVELAEEINATMPAYVVDRIQGHLDGHGHTLSGSKVLLVGVTYKPNIADERESPALPVARQLLDRGADVAYHDPLVDQWVVDGHRRSSTPLAEGVDWADVVVSLQNHEAVDWTLVVERSSFVFDTRGTLTGPSVVRM